MTMLNGNSFEDACRDVASQIAETVISKQHDYGQGNILSFREKGLVVRLSDKVARLKNLLYGSDIFFDVDVEYSMFNEICAYIS